MEQFILHLIGDYITQTDWMARNKLKRWLPAVLHALVYTVPFALLTQSPQALLFIFYTHLLIDHYWIARYVVFAKNWITQPSLRWKDCAATGYPPDVPAWMSVWLMIAADNTLHLLCNYVAIRWM